MNRESFWALVFIRRGQRSLQLIIFCGLSDSCRLQININDSPQGTDDRDQICLQRIVIRNRWFSKRDPNPVEIHPFIPGRKPTHWLSFLPLGPLRLLWRPHGWPLTFQIFAQMSLYRRPSWLFYLKWPPPLTLFCVFLALSIAWDNLFHLMSVSSLEGHLREVKDLTLLLAIFLELQCLLYSRSSVSICFLNE